MGFLDSAESQAERADKRNTQRDAKIVKAARVRAQFSHSGFALRPHSRSCAVGPTPAQAPGRRGERMKTRLPHMPFFVNDYIGATRHMTLAERGAYTDLLFLEWNIGPLPADPARLAAMIGCTSKQFSTVWPTVQQKFSDSPDGLVNERLELHRAKSIEISEKRAAIGRVGGIATAAKQRGTLQ